MQVSAPLRPNELIADKIASILSTSFTDSSIRDALEALDSRTHENTLETRQNLGSSVRADILRANGKTLASFSSAAEQLEAIGETISQLNGAYEAMDALVTEADHDIGRIASEFANLSDQSAKIRAKSMLLDAFQRKFVVAESDVQALINPERPADKEAEDALFQALARVKHIHRDCQLLLQDSATEQAGREIMTQMSQHLDQGYQRLFRSVQTELRGLSGQYIRIGKRLQRGLITLTERPTLFEAALTALTDVRQANLETEFVRALTAGSDATAARPIDYYAYDSLRYIGDIMAWIHSAAVNERENLEALFELDSMASGIKHGLESEPWYNDPDLQAFNAQVVTNQLVDTITASLLKPLRTRVEQVIQSEAQVTILYQVANVLTFYHHMFIKNFDAGAILMQGIQGLQRATMAQFDRRLGEHISAFKTLHQNHDASTAGQATAAAAGTSSADDIPLAPVLAQLKTVLTTYESSIDYDPEGSDTIKAIIENMVEPYLEVCSRISSNTSGTVPSVVFQINCLDAVKMCLSLFAVASHKLAQMDSRIEELTEVLADHQTRWFADHSGLTAFERQFNPQAPDQQIVIQLAQTLDEFLPAATMESNLALQNLSSPRTATTITLRASQAFCLAFEAVSNTIANALPHDTVEEIFPRTLSQVKVLLALD